MQETVPTEQNIYIQQETVQNRAEQNSTQQYTSVQNSIEQKQLKYRTAYTYRTGNRTKQCRTEQ